VSGLLIYDGDCGFCTTAATWIQRHWVVAGTRMTPWQFMGETELAQAGLSVADVSKRVYWHDETGAYGGERAIARALMAAGFPWRGLGHLIDIWPVRLLARPVYRAVARYRHHLPGGTPACQQR